MDTIHDDDVAIIGMAGLYPMADDVDCLWSNILGRVDAVTTSDDAWVGDGDILDPESPDPMKIYTRRGGFLGDLSRFDARAFGTMPMSVTGAQPDQFLALKVAHDALVDAGYQPGQFDGGSTGVILGHAVHAHRGNVNGVQQAWFHAQAKRMLLALHPDLPPERAARALRLIQDRLPRITPEAVPGLVPNIMTGRICNRLDLMGPNYIIDAACSSSLIAIDLAINELRLGHADMMLAGGVNTTTSPLVFSVFCSVDALSREGRIRPFDAGANGTVLGEGAGIVVLKRLKDALAADDRVYAVIKGVGQSSDGKSSGLMAPRLEGEVLAMRRAYANTGIDPATVGLVEAHGTGIPLGDRTEVDAMRTVFGSRQGRLPTIPIGSVKSMIGHCIPASGSAAVIKTSLALRDGVIPPTLCDEPSDRIGLDTTPFHVATEARPWIHSGREPRRAAINAFGFGGINAHMILEESPQGRSRDATAAFLPPAAKAPPQEQVFPFAASDRAGIVAAVAAFEAALAASAADLAALARQRWDAVAGDPGPARLAVVAAGPDDLLKKLAGAREKLGSLKGPSLQTRNGLYFDEAPIGGQVAFLFPGEMAQYPGMMRDAAQAFPAVRGWFDGIAALAEGRREVRLQDVIVPPDTGLGPDGAALVEELIHRVDYGSEMVFAADQGVLSLLTAMGIRPHAMLGHSTGENAALVASGRLDLDRAGVGELIARMNAIFGEVEASGAVPSGVLLNVAALERERLDALLAAHPGLHFTMDNCPNQAILFGSEEEVAAASAEAARQGAVCTRLPISWGYHTRHVAPMAEAFGELFEQVALRDSEVALYSCATAAPFPADRQGFKATAIAQYTSRVRFAEAVQRLHDDGTRVFVECGPNQVLTGFVRDVLGARPHLALSADNRKRGMVAQLRHLAGQLFAAGVPLDPRDLLMPQESAEQTRRRIARDKAKAAPRLPSDLPFVMFEGELAAEFARIVNGADAASAREDRPTAPVEAPTAAAATAPGPQPAPARMPEPATASAGGRLVPSMIARPTAPPRPAARPSPVPPALRPTRPAPTRPGAPVEVLDLSATFSCPFGLRAVLMRGAPSLNAVLAHLAPSEHAEAAEVAARRRPEGWQDWSLGRLAAKRAAGAMLQERLGQRPADAAMEIRKTAAGAPVLLAGGVPGPAISIAHVQGTAVAAAAPAGWRVGIDVERPGRIRDPAAFLAQITTREEWGALGLPPDPDAAALVWSAKEAAAKALGLGLQGQPRLFVVAGGDGRGVDLRVRHGAWTAEAQVRRLGDMLCTVAWIPDLGALSLS